MGGEPQVRERIEAVSSASAQLLLFQELLPANLEDWLADVLTRPDEQEAAAACALVADELRASAGFMAANGFVHFDAHFRNLLTDGRRLFFADLGLAASTDFVLDDDERAFVVAHATYDGANVLALLVYSVVAALTDAADWQERFALVKRWADGHVPAGVSAAVADVVGRYVPIAVVMNDFATRLMAGGTVTEYPAAAVGRAYAAATLP